MSKDIKYKKFYIKPAVFKQGKWHYEFYGFHKQAVMGEGYSKSRAKAFQRAKQMIDNVIDETMKIGPFKIKLGWKAPKYKMSHLEKPISNLLNIFKK